MRFQPVVEIEHHFVERQFVGHLRAAADIGQVLLDAAAVLAQLQDRAEIFVGAYRSSPRSTARRCCSILLGSGMSAGLCSSICAGAVGQLDLVDHRRRGGDQVEVVFAGQPLLDDLEVEQAEEPAAEAEAERGAGFHLEAEAGVVEAQLRDALAQLLEVGGVDREQPAEHHRLDFLEARQRLGGGALGVGDGVADARSARLP